MQVEFSLNRWGSGIGRRGIRRRVHHACSDWGIGLQQKHSFGRGSEIWPWLRRGLVPLKLFTVAGVVATLVSGCSSARKKEEVWTPMPRVSWEHIATRAVAAAPNSYRIIQQSPTTGLFPAGAAVTRVALTSNGVEQLSPGLHADPRNEFLRWNSVFDDQMAISEVFPIDQRDLGGGPAVPEQIVAAFRALRARIGLIYAVNELSPTTSEMFGVLYDVTTGDPVASIHAQAETLPMPEDVKKPDDPYHLWKTDARALVRQRFAELAHACVRELILNDQPARTEPPPGWTPAGPTLPVEWPPRQHPFRGRP